MPGLNQERRDNVVRLRMEEGLSYSQIGERLGITKNAAIGLARRAGVPPDNRFFPFPHPKREEIKSQIATGRMMKEIARATGASESTVASYRDKMREEGALVYVPPPRPKPADLPPLKISSSRTCQFITAAREAPGKPPSMCDAPVVEGKSWCPEHLRRCCVPVKAIHLPRRV